MKKLIAFLVALGLILSGGAHVALSASDGGYDDIPQWVSPPGGN